MLTNDNRGEIRKGGSAKRGRKRLRWSVFRRRVRAVHAAAWRANLPGNAKKKKSQQRLFLFCSFHFSLFVLHSSLRSTASFSSEEKREKKRR